VPVLLVLCDPEATRFSGGPMTPEQAPERLITERERDHSLGLQYWLIFLRDTEEFAGCAGLRPWSKDPLIIEVDVNLMRAAWGQRLGEEAILAALAHVFNTLKLPVVVSGHGIDHDNSRKLLERVGLTYTHNILWGPKEIEVCMWAITAENWSDKRRSPQTLGPYQGWPV